MKRFKLILKSLAGLLAIGLLALFIWVIFLARDLPSFDELERFEPPFSTRIFSADSVLLGEYFTQRRFYVPLTEISPYMTDAVIALEDHRFYEHWGVDISRIIQALIIDIRHLSFSQGGSTLTQQLAKNLFLTQEKSISRKIREIFTAIQLERTYTKPEILEMYLTLSYFGHGAYGIQSAAELYFGKRAADLEIHEAALLTSLLKSPARYSPRNHPARAMKRRNLVIRMMQEHGFITPTEARFASEQPLDLQDRTGKSKEQAPYFIEYVRQQMEHMRRGNPEETHLPHLDKDIYEGGLNIYTTLDSRLQAIADSAMSAQIAIQDTVARDYYLHQGGFREYFLTRNPALPDSELQVLLSDSLLLDSLLQEKVIPQGAFVALDPTNGDILAMIGGRNFEKYKFNRSVQAVRQPGSLFKPILYLEALEAGYPPSFHLPNQDIVVIEKNGRRWTPRNWDGSRGGSMSIREGLAHSLNLISVRLMMEAVPPDRVIKRARSLGISTPLAADYTLALGSSGVIPMEMVSAYSVFAAQGIYHAPRAIREIRDRNGNLLFRLESEPQEVLSSSSAYMITNLMQGVVDDGTAGSLRWRYGFYDPLAGKTGTTNRYTDAWFIGFTPTIAAGAWIGMDDPQFKLGRSQYGGKVSLPVFGKFIKAWSQLPEYSPTEFVQPADIITRKVCHETGQLATPLCPEPYDEIFLPGTEPISTCSKHRYH